MLLFRGSIQMLGAIIWFDVSAVMMLPDHFFFAQPQFAGAHAIDFQPQRGIVQILRNVDVGDIGNPADLAGHIERRLIAGLLFVPPICTSIGACIPMFNTASTRLPEEKNSRQLRHFAFAGAPSSRSMYS